MIPQRLVHEPLRVHATARPVARRMDFTTPFSHYLGERFELRSRVVRYDDGVEESARRVAVRRSVPQQAKCSDERADLGSIKRASARFERISTAKSAGVSPRIVPSRSMYAVPRSAAIRLATHSASSCRFGNHNTRTSRGPLGLFAVGFFTSLVAPSSEAANPSAAVTMGSVLL